MAATITVTYSELDAYRQCPLKHHLGYKARYSQPAREGTALARGSLWHEVMETHYRVLQRYPAAKREFKAVAKRALELAAGEVWPILHAPDGSQTEDQELIEWIYLGHVEAYGADPDWEILSVETEETVWLPTARGRRSRFRFLFKIDLKIRDVRTGQVWIVDHKSAKNFSRQVEIDLDDQFGLYTWGTRESQGLRAVGFIRSDARTQRNKGPMALADRFRRVPTYRTDKELDHLAVDAYRTATAAWGGPLKAPHSSPAPDRCAWRCGFLEVHLAARKGIPMATALKDFGFTQRESKHDYYRGDWEDAS